MQVSNCYTTIMAFLSHHSSRRLCSLPSSSHRQIVCRSLNVGRPHQHHHLYRPTNLNLSPPSPLSLSSSIVPSASACHISSRTTLSSSSPSSSSFEAPEPPAFNGTPIFPNVDLNLSPADDVNTKKGSEASFRRNSDPDAIFVVTGASRGIGLQMVKTLSGRVNGTIIACCRTPSDATQLNSFIEQYNKSTSTCTERTEATKATIAVEPLDVEHQPSIEALATKLQSTHGSRVDVLLNVAGILGDGGVKTPGPERSIRNLDRSWAAKTMEVNYFGPLFVSQALAPLMKTNVRGGRRKRQNNDTGGETAGKDIDQRPVSIIANLSARVGSISDNGLGGWISYRSSKAALNQATRTMALELKRQGTWTISLHPGTTDTDLSKPFQRNVKEGRLFPVDFTAERLLDVVDCMEEVHSGGFYDWSGTALPF